MIRFYLQTVKALPLSSTKRQIVTQFGIILNGPLISPAADLCAVLSAWDSSSDKPCVVKILLNAGKVNNQEACAVKILECGMDDNILLVKYKLIELILDESHSSTGHPPGRYELLILL